MIINANLANIVIPASTVVTSSDITWNGIMFAPKVTTVSLPETSGQSKVLSSAMELGFAGAHLSFDQGVRILMPGQAGKRVGYMVASETFTEITNTCLSDDQAVGNALASNSECKIDVGQNLVIWTKHFTTFATYTQTVTAVISTGGGGGGYIPTSCSEVRYGDWGTVFNGIQYRKILSQTPSNCSLTVSQIEGQSRPYVNLIIVPETGSSLKPVATTTKPVLVAKTYRDGTLLRASNKKIYVVQNGRLLHITTLAALRAYAGQKILAVSDSVISSYSKAALGLKPYGDNSLIRGIDKKIYVIKSGKKIYITSIATLKKYVGQVIYNVSDAVLNQY
jgi:hypothetical protein